MWRRRERDLIFQGRRVNFEAIEIDESIGAGGRVDNFYSLIGGVHGKCHIGRRGLPDVVDSN